MTLNPDQDAVDEKRSPPNPVPAFKKGLSNIGSAPAQLVRALSRLKAINSTIDRPARPASESEEIVRWNEPGSLSPV